MPKVKFFAVYQNSYAPDGLDNRLLPDISDWTEITDSQLNQLRNYRYEIEEDLQRTGIIARNEALLVVVDIPQHEAENALVKIDQLIESAVKKQAIVEEKRKQADKKRKETAEKKRAEKELQQLEKLKQKYEKESK